MNERVPANRYLIFASIALSGLGIDLGTKAWIFSSMPPTFGRRQVWWLIENFVGLETTLNAGALFGMGQGGARYFAILSICAAVGIAVWLFYAKAAHSLLLTVALGGITGGILGNLYDRLGYGFQAPDGKPVYAVRDWILFCYYDQYTWPNFNIADSLLVVGAALLAYQAFTQPAPATAVSAPAKASN